MNCFTVLPNPRHNNCLCAHDYDIKRFVSFFREGRAAIVLGDDDKFHVCSIDCLPKKFTQVGPEINPEKEEKVTAEYIKEVYENGYKTGYDAAKLEVYP